MDLVFRPAEAVQVTGVVDSDGPRRVMGGETVTLTTEDSVTITKVPPEELAKEVARPVSDDVHDPANRPNGPMSAAIAPKMPKPAGELEQVVEGDRVVERPVAERGRAEQGGGPASTDGRTPGPQPAAVDSVIDNRASATGTTDEQGRTRTATARTATKTSAKKSTTKRR